MTGVSAQLTGTDLPAALASAVVDVPTGRAAAVLVAVVAALAAVLVRPPGTRVLSDRLGTRGPGDGPLRPTGRDPVEPDRPVADPPGTGRAGTGTSEGVRSLSTSRSGLVVRASAVVVAVSASLLAAGADVGGGMQGAASIVGRSGLPGAAPALAVVAVLAARARLRGRRRRVAIAARASLIRGTEGLVADLRAGASSVDALAAAAAEVPELSPVVAAARLGGDVPAGLAALAGRPGLSGLDHLAAAWAVSAETGSSLTGTLEQLVDALRDAEEVRQETEVSLATPRATARLLAVLPAAGIGLGTVVGADPWGFLTGSVAGAVIATTGALLAGIGLEWVELLADRVQRVGAERAGASPRGPAIAAGT